MNDGRTRDRFWMAVRLLLGVAGIAVVAWLVQDLGVDTLAAR